VSSVYMYMYFVPFKKVAVLILDDICSFLVKFLLTFGDTDVSVACLVYVCCISISLSLCLSVSLSLCLSVSLSLYLCISLCPFECLNISLPPRTSRPFFVSSPPSLSELPTPAPCIIHHSQMRSSWNITWVSYLCNKTIQTLI
jgi:hypothetical protein